MVEIGLWFSTKQPNFMSYFYSFTILLLDLLHDYYGKLFVSMDYFITGVIDLFVMPTLHLDSNPKNSLASLKHLQIKKPFEVR